MKYNLMRRAWSALAGGLVIGGMFAATASATSIYLMQSNCPPGTLPPYSVLGGGGVPAQPRLTLSSVTATNFTLSWAGPMGWYAVLGTPDLVNWTTVTNGEATDYYGSVTMTNQFNSPSASFNLIQTNSYAGSDQCSSCHGDKYTSWKSTLHGVAIREHVNPDGSLVTGRTLSCILCHSVGDNQPTGYAYVTNAGSINFNSPLANVGCEACHGPAGWHKNSEHNVILPVVSLDPAICGSCHQGATHPTYGEYTNTVLSIFGAASNVPPGIITTGVSHNQGGNHTGSCSWCHSAYTRDLMVQEYYDRQAGKPHSLNISTSPAISSFAIACVTCHDPHGSNYLAQLRYPTFSTNYYAIPAILDSRSVIVTNFNGTFTTNTVNNNTVADNLFNPNVQVCGQCHGGGRGARWDGSVYGLTTNAVVTNVTQTVVAQLYTSVTNSQVFTNVTFPSVFTNGVYVTVTNTSVTTNTYVYSYPSGQTNYTVVVTQTNPVIGVGVYTPLVPYTNNGTVYYSTNSSGFKTPHYPVQYNVLIGQLDYDYQSVAGVTNILTDPHTLSPNQCVDCHVPTKYATGAHANTTGHSFISDNNGCLATCHSSLGTTNALAAKVANLKLNVTNGLVRVVSLLNQWATNVAPPILQTNYRQLAWEFASPGVFGTKSTNNGVKYIVGPPSSFAYMTNWTSPSFTNDDLQLTTVPQDIRVARWSIYMIYYDQSLGVHNPTYVKALLADAETRVANQFINANYSGYFAGDNLTGTNSLTVNFTNLNQGGAAYVWNFGDGVSVTNNAPNASHTFTTGTYSVSCVVDGKPLTRTRYIWVH